VQIRTQVNSRVYGFIYGIVSPNLLTPVQHHILIGQHAAKTKPAIPPSEQDSKHLLYLFLCAELLY
jgi:hypothetical protein